MNIVWSFLGAILIVIIIWVCVVFPIKIKKPKRTSESIFEDYDKELGAFNEKEE